MPSENSKIDDNRRHTLLGVTDDSNAYLKRLLVDSTTGALKCTATLDTSNVATIALDNLASVAINAALVPGTAGALDFGSTTKPWGSIWLAGTSGTPGTNQFKITGASTSGVRTITLPDASITVNAAADISGTTLASNVVTSSLTTVGTLVNLTVTNTITGSVSGNAGTATKLATSRKVDALPFDGSADQVLVSVLTDGATPALDASLGRVFTLSAAGDRTIAVPTNATSGQKIIIAHTASGGARTLALNTGAGGFRFGSDITALTQTASGKTDYIGCIYNNGSSTWDVIGYVKGF